MSHPGWVMVSFLTELLSQSSKGIAQSLDNCANDTEISNALLKDSYNKVREKTNRIQRAESTVRVDINVFLMVFSNGTLWTNYRMKLTGPCDMKLKKFPFDKQKCYLTFES
ncbi:unnamed protein product [Caenorhabditis brenneri]